MEPCTERTVPPDSASTCVSGSVLARMALTMPALAPNRTRPPMPTFNDPTLPPAGNNTVTSRAARSGTRTVPLRLASAVPG